MPKSLFSLLFFLFSPFMGQASTADSLEVEIPRFPTSRFEPRQLAFPAAALALGSAGLGSHLIDVSHQRSAHEVEDGLQYVPLAAYAGLGFIPGVKHRHNIGQRLMAGATAYVVMTGLTQGLKYAVRETRPDLSDNHSFPSGHTATAFCGAELTRIEYGNAYGAAAYAFAAATGVMRVVNKRHWCNDVLAGAGIGFLSAHVGYWLLPLEQRAVQKLFKKKNANALKDSSVSDVHGATSTGTSSTFVLAPSYNYETKSPALSFSMSF